MVGLLGLRQSGKSTYLRDLLKAGTYVTFDDDDSRGEAEASMKSFLAQYDLPLIVDEAQKVPAVFDQIKAEVDRKRVPGRYFLTGSSDFVRLDSIRESLTGRIGLIRMFPMTLAEMASKELEVKRAQPIHSLKPRFATEDVVRQLRRGGLPVPAFIRQSEMLRLYFESWTQTSLGRDLARVYGRGFNADSAQRVVSELARCLAAGEVPTVSLLGVDRRIAARYLSALETLFLIRRIPCHEKGTGHDAYWVTDSGILHHLLPKTAGPAAQLSLVRTFLQNEVLANCQYAGTEPPREYFKSAKGTPIDWVWQGIPVQVSIQSSLRHYDQRSLEGAMQALKSPLGIITAPISQARLPKGGRGIAVVPWSYWS